MRGSNKNGSFDRLSTKQGWLGDVVNDIITDVSGGDGDAATESGCNTP